MKVVLSQRARDVLKDPQASELLRKYLESARIGDNAGPCLEVGVNGARYVVLPQLVPIRS